MKTIAQRTRTTGSRINYAALLIITLFALACTPRRPDPEPPDPGAPRTAVQPDSLPADRTATEVNVP